MTNRNMMQNATIVKILLDKHINLYKIFVTFSSSLVPDNGLKSMQNVSYAVPFGTRNNALGANV